MSDENKMLLPTLIVTDSIDVVANTRGYGLFKDLKPGGFFHLHSVWGVPTDMPSGYDYYIVSFHMEHIDFAWLEKQSVTAPIIVLIDFNNYPDSVWPKHCIPMRWIYWHHALNQMMNLFGINYTKDIKYKASAFCNRISQSKVIVTTALLETLSRDELLVSVSDWLEDKNVHNWQSTGNSVLDALTNTFRKKYFGNLIAMDEFSPEQNYQYFTANPTQIAYQEAALHFTNESFHYSRMENNGVKQTIPGPHFTEKTFKCLLGGTAFIPVGQFDVYRSLEQLGMRFDYGDLDLSFDQDSGNMTRLQKIVELVGNLHRYTASDIYEMTRSSSEYNQRLVTSGKFDDICEEHNQQTLDTILECTKSL